MSREVDIDPMSMPVCPLCDNGMEPWDIVEIVHSFRSKVLGLAHTACVDANYAESGQFGAGA